MSGRARGLLGALLGLWLTSCDAEERPVVVVGSKSFAESRLLGEMLAQTLTAQRPDWSVRRELGLGGTKIVFEAVRNGEVDVYPEYTGTILLILLDETPRGDEAAVRARARDQLGERFGLDFIAPFGFSNPYVLGVAREVAERLGLEKISDVEASSAQIRAAFTHEFLGRADGVSGLEEAYGFRFENRRGVTHQLAYRAIRSGEADLIDAYSTDGKLVDANLILLEDDRGFFPPYEAGWLVSRGSLERLPHLDDVLDSFSGRIDEKRMRRWNYEVEERGREIAAVASEALGELGLPFPRQREESSTWRDLRQVLALTGEHVWLTALSVLSAALLAIPLGVVLSRLPRLADPVIAGVGVIQTIPSIALLAILIPLLGLGAGPALVALFLYALLPILRNTTVGIRDIDPVLKEAACGLGMTPGQQLRHLELPLALPVIFAGLRTATVINIGTATLAAFIGAGGLGELIKSGLDLNSDRLIVLGAVPAAMLAWGADWLLGRIERRVTPGPGVRTGEGPRAG